MDEDKLEIEYMGIDEVESWDDNPKEHNMTGLNRSVDQFGARQPILIQKGTNRIIAGHGRLKAYREKGMEKIPIMTWDCTDEEADAYSVADNQLTMAMGWDEDELAEFMPEIDEEYLDSLGFDESELMDLLDEEEIEEFDEDVIEDISDLKILNLYAGIGGNRKLWGDEVDVTAVEWNEEIASAYQDFFPHDKVIVEDAHTYLEKHFDEYDFIWSSPPCPTHSRMRKNFQKSNWRNMNAVYPNLNLYEEILFLEGYFEGKYCVENVKSWYDPLIEPQEINRHYYWSNFEIKDNEKIKEIRKDMAKLGIEKNVLEKQLIHFGYDKKDFDKIPDLSDYPRDKIIRNMVHPKTGKQILECVYENIKDET